MIHAKQIKLLVMFCLLNLVTLTTNAQSAFESAVIEIIKPLTNSQDGEIRVYPEGRINCVNCYVDAKYTLDTVIYKSGAKQKYSALELASLKFKYADVLIYEDGSASSINVYGN